MAVQVPVIPAHCEENDPDDCCKDQEAEQQRDDMHGDVHQIEMVVRSRGVHRIGVINNPSRRREIDDLVSETVVLDARQHLGGCIHHSEVG